MKTNKKKRNHVEIKKSVTVEHFGMILKYVKVSEKFKLESVMQIQIRMFSKALYYNCLMRIKCKEFSHTLTF